MPIAARSPNGVLLPVCALALLATGCGDSSDGNTPTDSTTGGTLGSGATGGVSANGAGDAGATGSGGAVLAIRLVRFGATVPRTVPRTLVGHDSTHPARGPVQNAGLTVSNRVG